MIREPRIGLNHDTMIICASPFIFSEVKMLFYRGWTPVIFSTRSPYPPLCQFVGSGLIGKPAHERFAEQAHGFRFFVVDCKIPVCTALITKQMGKRYTYISIGKTFSFAPFYILRNTWLSSCVRLLRMVTNNSPLPHFFHHGKYTAFGQISYFRMRLRERLST